MTNTKDGHAAPGTKGRVLHWAAGYDVLAWLFLLGRERTFRDRLVRLARLGAGQSVLDIGCGTGSLAIAAKRVVGPSGTVDGIDASPEMIARATRKASNAGADVRFTTGVVEKLPYPAEHFDMVLSTLMFHHLPRDARQQCAREIRRVLKPGGRVLIVDFGKRAKDDRKGLLDHLHRHGGVALDDIVDILGKAGLDVIETGSLGMRNMNFVRGAVA